METSTTRGRFKKPIGSGTDVGTEGIVIGMMTIDIRAALLNCGDIAFELVDICIVCILICTHRPLALMCITWYNKSFFRSSSRYSWYDSTLVIVYFVYLTLSDLIVTYAGQQLANDRIGNSEALWFWGFGSCSTNNATEWIFNSYHGFKYWDEMMGAQFRCAFQLVSAYRDLSWYSFQSISMEGVLNE